MILEIANTDVSEYVEVGYQVTKQNIVKNQWEGIDGSEGENAGEDV